MRKKLANLLVIFCILLNLIPFGLETYAQAEVQDGGNFYKDFPEAENSPLGAAQYFHIFSNDVTLKSHTNGNIAAKYFNGGNANFGTNGYSEKEYFYLQNIDSINASSGIEGDDHNKIVVGTSVDVDISNLNRPILNHIPMDHLTASQIYQDQGSNQYIDFEKEMETLKSASQKMSDFSPDLIVQKIDFSDMNNRVVDVSLIDKKAVFITVSADVLQTGTPLKIIGLEKGADCSTVKNVFINVDTGGQNPYTINSQINLSYTDGTNRHNQETTDFSDSTLLWNFTDNGNPYAGKITIQSPWQGSILAPLASIDGTAINIDGSIMADKFLGAGETHRWDWQGCFPTEEIGSVVLTKVDGEDQAKVLPGAEFSLYTSEGQLIEAGLTTDENGQITYDNLSVGSYYFIETKAPNGYQLEENKHSFEIKAGEVSTPVGIKVTNKAETEEIGSVVLTKVDGEDQAKVLPGAVFSLYTSEGELIEAGLTTDENGQITYDNLSVGSYYFIETKAPNGYQLEENKHSFEIKAGEVSTPVGIKVTNKAETEEIGSVVLTKVDGEDQAKVLPGAVFSLYTSEGELIEAGLTTDENGQITYDNLSVGSYYFIETKAPNGYQLEENKHSFEIKAGEVSTPVEIKVTNKAETEEIGSVVLTKVDGEDQAKVLPGAVFSLYTSEGELIEAGLTTDENGQIAYDNLSVGSYYFIETKAPNGYQLEENKHSFEIKAGEVSTPVEIKVTNKAETEEIGSVVLTKVDGEDQAKVLPGAEFSLYTSEGQLIEAGLTTDENGQIAYDNLSVGSYYFIETKAPNGYQLEENKHSFEIKAGEVSTPVEIKVTNKAETEEIGSVVLTKVDGEDQAKVLPGAEFSLYTSEGQLIEAGLTTDENGQIAYDNLSVGSYYFIETKAPNGYQLEEKKHSFEIKAGEVSTPVEIKVTNKAEPTTTLPNTGDESNSYYILGLLFIGLGCFAILIRKKIYNYL